MCRDFSALYRTWQSKRLMLCPTSNGFSGKVDKNEIKSSKALCGSLYLTSLLWKNILFPNTWICVISIASFDIDWFVKTYVLKESQCVECAAIWIISADLPVKMFIMSYQYQWLIYTEKKLKLLMHPCTSNLSDFKIFSRQILHSLSPVVSRSNTTTGALETTDKSMSVVHVIAEISSSTSWSSQSNPK